MRLEALDPCVHCGFCLPACPTYLATGDEAESPRGRIVLMRELEEGRLRATDPVVIQHLDSCLGCLGCEPACPSGVRYGEALAVTRSALATANGVPMLSRVLLGVFGSDRARVVALALARILRRLPLLPPIPTGLRRLQAQLRATTPSSRRHATTDQPPSEASGVVGLFRGCVMEGLFRHVHEATRRTLSVNGYTVVDLDTGCCGALHEHSGDSRGASRLARRQVDAIRNSGVDLVVVNSAGCGAMLKSYSHLLDNGSKSDGSTFAVRDVAELLAEVGPLAGAALPGRVVYDPPCHLKHAQGVHDAVMRLLLAIPGLEVDLLPGSDQCCGSAGLHGVLHRKSAEVILGRKIAELEGIPVPIHGIVTGNPGCIMQIGGGLVERGAPIPVRHPIELLDESYARAGWYNGDGTRQAPAERGK